MKKQAKYEVIYQELKRQIFSGAFPDGKLPPLPVLTKRCDASLLTPVLQTASKIRQNALATCAQQILSVCA